MTERAVIALDDRHATVTFAPPFSLEGYDLFLRCKRLPESTLEYDPERDTYVVRTPARFARLLGAAAPGAEGAGVALSPHLFDYQAAVLQRALEAKRYAAWWDTGLGKSALALEWARQVMARTGGRVLIFSPPGPLIEQTRAEAVRWYGDALPVERLDTREALAAWCRADGAAVGITNYEKLIPGVLNELRHLGGLVLDEASVLKTAGGTIKWNLMRSAYGIEYKLACTATPAPNDTMEYASQAGFLERLRSEGEILWTFFTRTAEGQWRVKPHARSAFFAFMASWSIYLRDPARYGWTDILATLPRPITTEHRVPITAEQRAAMYEILTTARAGLFGDRIGVRERTKLAQIARGFLYEDGGVRRIPSRKPAVVADLVRAEVAAGRPVIVWTIFDEESAIVTRLLGGLRVATLHGSTPAGERERAVAAFRAGEADVLVTKARLVGHGLNFQRCQAMVFSGIDDSFERMYQAVRRAYRYGQTEPVRVHIPYVPELEGVMHENVQQKQARFEAEAAEQERHYIAAWREARAS